MAEWANESIHVRGQCNSVVAHCLMVPGDHGSNSGKGENIFPFRFLSGDLMIAIFVRKLRCRRSGQFHKLLQQKSDKG